MSDTSVTRTEGKPTRYEGATMLPPVDVVENEQEITLYADLPGVPKDKLNIRVESDVLTIEGEVALPLATNIEASHAEVRFPRYQRSFTLGQELDRERVVAQFKNGVLELHIPKAEHAKARKVEVEVA